VIMMHMQGQPADMQLDPRYHFAPFDVYDWLADRIDVAVAAGIAPSQLIVDPGYGFGKTIGHNLQLLDWLSLFLGLGCALLVGVSRKSSIAKIAFPEAPERLPAADRLPGSLALGLAAVGRGASIVRVHDVAETAQALRLWQAVTHAAQG
ncbi:MAG: dihydropteroate synthase, partial [Rhodospirillaceae bacterium]